MTLQQRQTKEQLTHSEDDRGWGYTLQNIHLVSICCGALGAPLFAVGYVHQKLGPRLESMVARFVSPQKKVVEMSGPGNHIR